jgi:hypothetical protein
MPSTLLRSLRKDIGIWGTGSMLSHPISIREKKERKKESVWNANIYILSTAGEVVKRHLQQRPRKKAQPLLLNRLIGLIRLQIDTFIIYERPFFFLEVIKKK